MFPRIINILSIAFLLVSVTVNSQSRYRFFTLRMDDGLTSDYTWSVCQDKYKYIWIGTQNGLNRYDGHHIRQYFHDPKNPYSLPGNSIYWMHKDSDGELWFALGRNGLAKYNYALDRFERFAPFDSLVKKLNRSTPLWRIGADQKGRMYFACGSAVFRYTKNKKLMEDLTPLFNGKIEGYGVGMFIPQGNDIMWIMTGNSLFKYDLHSESVRHIPLDANKFGFGSTEMHDGEFVNDHTLLVTVPRSGFLLFDTRTEKFSLPPAPFNPTSSEYFSETGGVMKDSKGRIWLANSRFGLLEYFQATNTTYSLKNEISYPYPYNEQEGRGMNVYEDSDGNIWYCSSNRGVIWFKPSTDFMQVFQRDYSKAQTLPDNTVNWFFPSGNNNMIIGTNRGIAEFNTRALTYTNYPVAYNEQDKYPNAFIRCMESSGDSVFITTYQGLSIFNKRTKDFSRYVSNDPKRDSIFVWGKWLIHHVAPGELVISANNMIRFFTGSRKFVLRDSTGKDPLYNLSDINASFFDEKNNVLWMETGVGKLTSYNTKTKKVEYHHYTNDSVMMVDALKMDSKGRIWIGSTSGLYHFDPSSKKAGKIYLGPVTKDIYNIEIENDEWIWLSTPYEVIRYNTNTGKTDLLPSHLFLPNSFISKRAFYLDSEKFLWVGTNKGFCKIDTRRFSTSLENHEPQLVDFSVLNEDKSFGTSFNDLEKIVLKHHENFFSFEMSSFNYLPQSSVKYSYMLEGFDNDWRTGYSNSASYTNVPPGKYYLHLRASNSSGGWTERGKPVEVIIKPAFWQTWWFYSLIALIAASIIASVYTFRRKRKQEKQIDNAIDYFANSLVYGEDSVNEICWDVARNCMTQLDLKDCVVYLVDEEKQTLVQKAAFGPKNPKDQEIINPIEIEIGKGIVGTAASTAKPVLVRDTRKDERYIADDDYRLSELAVPILHEGKAIGVIDSEHPKKGFFTEEHVKAMTTIAAICANKIAETRAAETAKEKEIQLLEIRKLLAESQLMALRAQMNPHFVFNCLNSIQECIVTKKYGEASLYLNKFSKLFRSILSNSGKIVISLAEEIEILQLYLSLEHMRFEKSFYYTIDIEESLEVDEIGIPSMLLQPFVENALWHGLMHKPADRQLNISFSKIDEETFRCVIDDNGIGRKKAGELRQQQVNIKKHVSKGMSIASDRIELIRKQGDHASLQIIDKLNHYNEPQGTTVIVELSTYLKD